MSRYKTDPEARKEIDSLLESNAKTQAALGTENTEQMAYAKELAKEYWSALHERIKAIDPEFAAIVEPQN
jgi:tRNA A37 N6-isopentenylltransferase MiaA